jgi:hypothetical protein
MHCSWLLSAERVLSPAPRRFRLLICRARRLRYKSKTMKVVKWPVGLFAVSRAAAATGTMVMIVVPTTAAVTGIAITIDGMAGSIETIANESVGRDASTMTIDAGNGALRSAAFLSRYRRATRPSICCRRALSFVASVVSIFRKSRRGPCRPRRFGGIASAPRNVTLSVRSEYGRRLLLPLCRPEEPIAQIRSLQLEQAGEVGHDFAGTEFHSV